MKIYWSWSNPACIGHRWDELGLSLLCCPQRTAVIETSHETLYWVRAESASRLRADCLTVLSHMLSILRSQWEKNTASFSFQENQVPERWGWRAERWWGAPRYCCVRARRQPGHIHTPMTWDALLGCVLRERLEVYWLSGILTNWKACETLMVRTEGRSRLDKRVWKSKCGSNRWKLKAGSLELKFNLKLWCNVWNLWMRSFKTHGY